MVQITLSLVFKSNQHPSDVHCPRSVFYQGANGVTGTKEDITSTVECRLGKSLLSQAIRYGQVDEWTKSSLNDPIRTSARVYCRYSEIRSTDRVAMGCINARQLGTKYCYCFEPSCSISIRIYELPWTMKAGTGEW